MKVKKGFYNKKAITAVMLNSNVIQRYQYDDRPGEWFFPLIENGVNVDWDKFKLNACIQRRLPSG